METSSITIEDRTKETCAIETMRHMLSNYSEQNQISFEAAFFQFANSPIYTALFDYSTAIWKEGPDYLQGLFEEYLQKRIE